MTNIVCLLYVGWVTNYIANIHIRVPVPSPERKLEGDKRGDTVRIMERLDRLENVVNQHIQGRETPSLLLCCACSLRAAASSENGPAVSYSNDECAGEKSGLVIEELRVQKRLCARFLTTVGFVDNSHVKLLGTSEGLYFS